LSKKGKQAMAGKYDTETASSWPWLGFLPQYREVRAWDCKKI